MKALIGGLTIAFAAGAYAGSADAIIKGKTGTGRTQLEIQVQDIEYDVHYLKFTVDGKSLEISDFSIGGICEAVICDRKNKVYTISIQTPHAQFKFWMVPSSLKVERFENRERWTFTAIAVGTDPRFGERGHFTPEIEMPCTLEWDI